MIAIMPPVDTRLFVPQFAESCPIPKIFAANILNVKQSTRIAFIKQNSSDFNGVESGLSIIYCGVDMIANEREVLMAKRSENKVFAVKYPYKLIWAFRASLSGISISALGLLATPIVGNAWSVTTFLAVMALSLLTLSEIVRSAEKYHAR